MRNIWTVFLYFDETFWPYFYILIKNILVIFLYCDMGFSTNILTIFLHNGDYYFG